MGLEISVCPEAEEGQEGRVPSLATMSMKIAVTLAMILCSNVIAVEGGGGEGGRGRRQGGDRSCFVLGNATSIAMTMNPLRICR